MANGESTIADSVRSGESAPDLLPTLRCKVKSGSAMVGTSTGVSEALTGARLGRNWQRHTPILCAPPSPPHAAEKLTGGTPHHNSMPEFSQFEFSQSEFSQLEFRGASV